MLGLGSGTGLVGHDEGMGIFPALPKYPLESSELSHDALTITVLVPEGQTEQCSLLWNQRESRSMLPMGAEPEYIKATWEMAGGCVVMERMLW